jgi:nitrite reductase (NADH) small subunit
VKHAVFGADELGPGEKRRVEIDRRGIVVVKTEAGELYALADTCPHQGARLSDGYLSGEVSALSVGATELKRPGEVLRCPWHNFAFDVCTGLSLLEPERYRVKSYPVSVEDGRVLVDV